MGINYEEIFSKTENDIKEINRKAKAEITTLQKNALKTSVELFTEIGWDKWSESQLENEEQYSRFQKVFTDKMKIISIDYSKKCGQVNSSQVYDVNENGCTCKDSSIRGLPCKHMYFLAYQLSKGKSNSAELQLTLDTIDKSDIKQDNGSGMKFQQLGCCSLFRDCSRAGRCLQKDDYYKQCGYRKNLENGNIFYTEKSNSFSKERYDYIENFRNSLNDSERNVFDEIITYFERDRRGVQSCFCLFTPRIKSIIEECKAFELLSPKELVRKLFETNLISNKRATELHSKYSKLPKPKLITNNSNQSEALIKEENKTRLDNNLKIWENHFLADPDLLNVLSEEFLYFQESGYSFEMNELFVENYNEVARDLKELVYFDSNNPKLFRDKIV